MKSRQARPHPHLFEANAMIFLKRLSQKYKRKLTLASVPQEEWNFLAKQGFDFVWLMGVWKRSPKARQLALQDKNLQKNYDTVLPDWKPADVTGSPYAIYDYSLEPALGEEGDFAALKSHVNQAGLKLILDFVPNHLAMDHPWVKKHPSWFVNVPEALRKEHPGWSFEALLGIHLAHGRDPYFDPWNDTVQNDFFSTEMRTALLEIVLKIAEFCDGLRCDMAMLALNQIFQNVWGKFMPNAKAPAKEFWAMVIPLVKRLYPDFIFIAEAYWDLEWELQQMGFDFTYDKKLYDRLYYSKAEDVRGHLTAESDYQKKSVRFIENHDEPRAVTHFGEAKSQAAVAVAATLQGLRFFHDGQLEGRAIKLPIQLVREPEEKVNEKVMRFYERLLKFSNAEILHFGKWSLLYPISTGNGNDSYRNVLAWSWQFGSFWRLVIVNDSGARAQARIRLDPGMLKNKSIQFVDHALEKKFLQDTQEIRTRGLYADLAPWQCHLFEAG